MKAVSTVVATLLMLIITIGLAGIAYSYISGVLTTQTAVVLELVDSICDGTSITTTVRNSGTTTSGAVTVSATNPAGASAGSCSIASIQPGLTGSCSFAKTGTAGTYRLLVSASGAKPQRGTVFCPA
jgi:FlaG/FlaF family flagellin (archaellin)